MSCVKPEAVEGLGGLGGFGILRGLGFRTSLGFRGLGVRTVRV